MSTDQFERRSCGDPGELAVQERWIMDSEKERFLTKAPGRHARRAIQEEAETLLKVAHANGVQLGYADMDVEDGMITIDGMEAGDWMRAMIGFEAWEARRDQ